MTPRIFCVLLVPLWLGLAGCATPDAALRCGYGSQCESGVCREGQCQAPACTDRVKNGDEGDVDCGGACPARCVELQACRRAEDCASATCEDGRCRSAQCDDGVKNGAETDIDCGGGLCQRRCAEAAACARASDCGTGVCADGRCAAATCADGVKNGAELDVDCGGPCTARCSDGKGCAGPADCGSGVCAAGRCAAAACTDGVKNGAELDVDCGGPCGACPVGKRCVVSTDCLAAVCDAGACRLPRSAKELRDAQPLLGDGPYTIDPDGAGPVAAMTLYCLMSQDGGGWALVLKTNAVGTAHYTDQAVSAALLGSSALTGVAKLADADIRALQAASGVDAETRVESPTFAVRTFARRTGWSVPRVAGYASAVQGRTSAMTDYQAATQCYDSELYCGADHYCVSSSTTTAVEHICVRRFATPGIWFNGGTYSPGSYQAGRVWIR